MREIKLKKLQFFFLSLLSFYPLLKFDWVSKILVLFFLITIYGSFKKGEVVFEKTKLKKFILFSSYFLLLILSIFYSDDKQKSIKIISQLSPLLLVPFLISFFNINISKQEINKLFKFYILSNFLFSVFIVYLFLTNPDRFEFNISHYLFDYDKFQYIINNNLYSNFYLVHKAYFSMGFVLCAVFAINKTFSIKNGLYKTIYFFVFIYFFCWIFYAFSFPNVIALLLSISILLYIKLSRKVFFSIISLFILANFFLLNIKFKDIDFQRGLNFFKSSITNKSYEVNDSRTEVYKSIHNIYKNSNLKEFLFGFGVGDSQDRLKEEYKSRLALNKCKNLIYFSEEFDNKYWFKHNVNIKPNQNISIFNIKNAEALVANTLDKKGSHNISIDFEVDKESNYTFSIYAKKYLSDFLILRLGDENQKVVFDLKKGTVLKAYDVLSAEIKQIENGWYRCFINVTLEKSGLALVGLSNKNGDYNYTSKDPQGIYLWGSQLEENNISSYVRNNNENIQIALNENLNTHNNYLDFYLSIGLIGVLLFLIFIYYLFFNSFRPFNIIKLTFCLIISINFLTENILVRQWGIIFFSFFLIILFKKSKKELI